MFSPEQLYYEKILGIRKEFAELNPIATSLLLARAIAYTRKHQSVIEGYPLPRQGSAILVGNHHREEDSYKGLIAGRRVGRLTTRTVVKRSLVYPNSQESAQYLASIGDKQDDLNKYDPLRAWVLKRVGVIDILRDNPDRGLIRRGDQVLRTEQLLGIYGQPTRYDDCILRNLQEGAAVFARRHPDVLVYPIAFSGPPDGQDRMTTTPPFTYNQKREEYGREISVGEFTVIIFDAIARRLPSRPQDDWWQRTRAHELDRLTSTRRPAA